MPRPFSLALAASSALMPLSCVSVLGIEDDKKSAVETYCRCDEVNGLYGNSPAACAADIAQKLERATEPTRATWLKTFEKRCVDCTQWAACFKLAPTCTGAGAACRESQCSDCCAPSTQPSTCGEEGG